MATIKGIAGVSIRAYARTTMESEQNLSGYWVGEYYQQNSPHPIALDLKHEGDHLTGTMTDGETDRESTVFEATAGAGLPPGTDEQIVAQLTSMFPDTPADTIRYITHLPPESSVEGWFHDATVYFLKTYEGVHFGGYKVGERVVGHVNEEHSVHYKGKLSPDGREIEGKWWIESEGGRVVPRNEGSFVLRR
jgi:hypothetical protein